ncbi:MAG: hypothetical protein ABII68_06235 [Pseudomonadota bacterium]
MKPQDGLKILPTLTKPKSAIVFLTADGIAEAELLGASLDMKGDSDAALGDAPVPDETGSHAAGQIASGLKSQLGE